LRAHTGGHHRYLLELGTIVLCEGHFDPSTLIRATRKHLLSALWQLPSMKKTFVAFPREHIDQRALARSPVDAACAVDERKRAKE
jgi:hypothetical protein